MRSFDGTQDVLTTFPRAVPAIGDVISLLVFVFLVYSILGLNLFGLDGQMHGRCVVADGNSTNTHGLLFQGNFEGRTPVCGSDSHCPEGFRCSCKRQVYSNGSIEQPPYAYQDPVTGDPGCFQQGSMRPWKDGGETPDPVCPNYGFICFDNFALAIFTCFVSITLDSWSISLWWAIDASSEYIAVLYFFSLISVVAFNVVNLTVAAVSSAYQEVRSHRRDIDKARIELRKRREATGTYQMSYLERVNASINGYFQEGRERNTVPLNMLAFRAKQFISHPQLVDECGTVLAEDLVQHLFHRNLKITFGPEFGAWTLIADRDGASSVENQNDESAEYPVGQVVEQGVSTGDSRPELHAALHKYAKAPEKALLSASNGPPYFDILIMFCIFVNTIVMTFEHWEGTPIALKAGYVPEDNCCDAECNQHDHELCPRGLRAMPLFVKDIMVIMEGLFDLIFTLELITKLVAYWSMQRFFSENYPFNIIDFLIVVASDAIFFAEFFVHQIFNVQLFRLIRITRTFRIVNRMRRLRLLVHKAIASFKTILNVLFVLVFWHILGALLGMQIFGCSARDEEACQQLADGSCPEGCSLLLGNPAQCVFSEDEIFDHCPWDEYFNFNEFSTSMIVLVFVSTGENWVEVMINAMRANPTIWPGLIFFMVFYIVSFYMLLNLFVGVILEEFELTDEDKEGLQLGNFRVAILKELRRKEKGKLRSSESLYGQPSFKESLTPMSVDGFQELSISSDSGLQLDTIPAGQHADDSTILGCLPAPTPNERQPDAPKNIRSYASAIANDAWFERLILLTIILSAVSLAMDSPVPEFTSIGEDAARISDYVFFTIFVFEFVVKILEHGIFWEHKEAYFRSSWNHLDFVILVFQLLDISGIQGLKSLRVMRVIRPLRLLNKIKSLQLLLISIQASTTDMFNVLLLWFFFCVVFSITGVNLFAGKLYACNDGDFVGPAMNPGEPEGSSVGWRENCVGSFFTSETSGGTSYVSDVDPVGILKPRVWNNPTEGASAISYNFDNFALAFQSLFEVSTFEKWSDYVLACVDITGIGQQPALYNNITYVIFFHAWVVMSCFFVQQLVIGVLIEAINQKNGTALYTDLQRNWMRMTIRMQAVKPLSPVPIPTSPFRHSVWLFANGGLFVNSITVVIVVNIVLMATESYNQPEWWTQTMSLLNWVFIGIYVFEIIIKFVAYLHLYFLDAWNVFDLAVVLSSIVESSFGGGGVGLQALRTLRILKVLRTLRLVRRARRLRLMISALMNSIPPILSSMVFMGLFMFLFAILGVQFFSGVRHGMGIHEQNNFHTTWEGLKLLSRAITGEDWQTVMRDCAIEPPACTDHVTAQMISGDPHAVGDCGSATGSYLFFDIFFLVGNNMLLNLFVAVLLESFNNFQVQNDFILSEQHLESYQEIWRDLDPMGKGRIGISKLRTLLERLHANGNPLGTCVLANEFKYRCLRVEAVQSMQIGENLDFSKLLLTLGMHVVGARGLPYSDMLQRQEKMTYYAQIAAVGKMTALYRSVQDKNSKKTQRLPQDIQAAGPKALAGFQAPSSGDKCPERLLESEVVVPKPKTLTQPSFPRELILLNQNY